MNYEIISEQKYSRRQVLGLGGVALMMATLGTSSVLASPKEARAKMAEFAKGAEQQEGRVNILLPTLTQDGKRTRIQVSVDSPMTEDDYVKHVHILAERNTEPEIASYHFSPMSGKCEFVSRLRVAKSQTILVGAEMNDGSFYLAKARCNVARGAGGCG
jgi:sulfur-oxidizing protein SoxY